MGMTGKLATKKDEDSVFKTFTVKRIVDNDGTIHNKLEADVTVNNEISFPTGADKLATDANMRLVANTTEYTQSNLVNNVLTFASSKGISLKNDGNSDFTITIGSFIFTIRTGEVREIELASPFTSVTFSANAVFRAFGITRSA